ncbi:hypothetical protein [Fibrivirga algicola]|uniref:Uncharacterized protein n=1 Tax=Fibrivirga algicola TaxID=2950420 RepID=A0ABX0QHP6_9BACT|nr:hypothetical protein [Fibrivirga algicola]NID11562.1 hypothetical protein [Fibrivirga algicola]
MKPIHLCVLLVFVAGCQPEPVATQTYTQQGGIVKISVATRGSYQFILQPDGDDPAKKYLVTNYADSLKSYFLTQNSAVSELPVVFSGTTSANRQTVYQPAPNDVPVPAYDLPTIQLSALRRR